MGKLMSLELAMREGMDKTIEARRVYSCSLQMAIESSKEIVGVKFDSANEASCLEQAEVQFPIPPKASRRIVACALGAAYWGADGEPDGSFLKDETIIPFLREKCGPIVDLLVSCPDSMQEETHFSSDDAPSVVLYLDSVDEPTHGGDTIDAWVSGTRQLPLFCAIEILFEIFRWSRAEIADFIRTYEHTGKR